MKMKRDGRPCGFPSLFLFSSLRPLRSLVSSRGGPPRGDRLAVSSWLPVRVFIVEQTAHSHLWEVPEKLARPKQGPLLAVPCFWRGQNKGQRARAAPPRGCRPPPAKRER